MIDQSKCPNPEKFSFEGSNKTKTLRYGYRTKEQPGPAEQPAFYDS